jgi:RNA polymerase-binding transcription factor DksA
VDARRQAHFKELLLAERGSVAEELRRIAAVVAPGDVGLAEPGDEPDPGPSGGTFEDDLAIAARAPAALSRIDAALRLLEEEPDRYGVCITCGKRIGTARLEIMPATRFCEGHPPT